MSVFLTNQRAEGWSLDLSQKMPWNSLKCLGCFLSGSLHFVVGNKGKLNR